MRALFLVVVSVLSVGVAERGLPGVSAVEPVDATCSYRLHVTDFDVAASEARCVVEARRDLLELAEGVDLEAMRGSNLFTRNSASAKWRASIKTTSTTPSVRALDPALVQLAVTQTDKEVSGT